MWLKTAVFRVEVALILLFVLVNMNVIIVKLRGYRVVSARGLIAVWLQSLGTIRDESLIQLDGLSRGCAVLDQLEIEFKLESIQILQQALLIALLIRLEHFSDQV